MNDFTTPDFDARLRNWARAMRDPRPAPKVATAIVCEAIKRQDAIETHEVKDKPDERDAWLVEAAWKLIPLQPRLALAAYYVKNLPVAGVARQLKVSRNAATELLRTGALALAVKLAGKLDKIQHVLYTESKSSTVSPATPSHQVDPVRP